MRVGVFAAGIVELETRTAGQPDGGNGFVVECRGEFIEAREAASAEGDQSINGDVEDTGRLAQARLRSCEAHSIRNSKAGRFRGKRNEAGRGIWPPPGVAEQINREASLSFFFPDFVGLAVA